ncbi:hypothetical protein IJI94_00515 [Candidatus Saccharibacteria bacterium]|nr:hypothetical protein [Candidatus Saccharibacteria bacterium]
MNKETIYIEPENDITDIIAKIKGSKQKIVALVPPKKSSVLRSTINMKLITKAAKEFEKTVVLITTDPSIMKLAMSTKILVAENLQTPPAIPSVEDIKIKDGTKEEIIAEEFAEAPQPVDSVIESSELEDEKENEDEEKPSKKDKDAKKDKKDKKGIKIPSLDKYRKWIIIGAIALILIIGFLIWALVFAPKADIVVSIRTTTNNFSENISFTTKAEEEKAKEGKFLLEEQKYSEDSEVEFPATGKKDIGAKAKGEVVISATVKFKSSKTIEAGTKLTYNDLTYYTDSALTFTFDDITKLNECDNYGADYCTKSASVNVTAAGPGENYNIASGITLNSDNANINSAYSNSAFSGGTSNVVTVVQQLDIDAAKNKLTLDNDEEGKKKLEEEISDGDYILWDSFKSETAEPTSSIAVGAEVQEGTKPKLKATVTFYVYTIDLVRIEEFIREKTKLANDQKIYSLGDPFIDKYKDAENPAKIKTTYSTGPEITEESILEKVSGKKIGEAKTLIESINGVSKASINPSFFWVRKVPTDSNKVTVTIEEE